MQIMHITDTQPAARMRTLTVVLTDAEHAEFHRFAREKFERTPGRQASRVIREWIASEQAAEAADAAEGKAA